MSHKKSSHHGSSGKDKKKSGSKDKKGKSSSTKTKAPPPQPTEKASIENRTEDDLLDEFKRKDERILLDQDEIDKVKKKIEEIDKQTNELVNRHLEGEEVQDQINELIKQKKDNLVKFKTENLALLKVLHFWNLCYFELCKRCHQTEDEGLKTKIRDAILNSSIIQRLGVNTTDDDDIIIKEEDIKPVEPEPESKPTVTVVKKGKGKKDEKPAEEKPLIQGEWRGLPVIKKKMVIPDDKKDAFKESCLKMKNLTYPQVTKFYGYVIDDSKNFNIVMEYFPVNLDSFLHSLKYYYNDKKLFTILSDLVRNINFLFKNKIIHLNLKASNILFDRNYMVKFTDFREISLEKDKNVYQAPELEGKNGPYKFEDYFLADLYSLGVLLWELVHSSKTLDSHKGAPGKNLKEGEKVPEWVMDAKYNKLKELYEALTTPDQQERLQKLKGHYIEINDEKTTVSLSKISSIIAEVDKEIFAPNNTFENIVWEQATASSESKESIDWFNFYDKFQNQLPMAKLEANTDDKKVVCLREILGARVTPLVQKTRWEKFNFWFKDLLTDANNESSIDKVMQFLNDLEKLYTEEWWHGFILREDSHAALNDESTKGKAKDLYYLVRAHDEPGTFAIDYKDQDKDIITKSVKPPKTDFTVQGLIDGVKKALRDLKETNKGKTLTPVKGPGLSIFSKKHGQSAYTSTAVFS